MRLYMGVMAVSKENIQKLREFKIHPRETDNQLIERVIMELKESNNERKEDSVEII